MDVRFTTSRFGAGYDAAEVDDFLDRCDRALAAGDGSVTAETVLGARFTETRFREGYDMSEVDAFLDDVLAPRFRAAGGGSAPQESVVGTAEVPAAGQGPAPAPPPTQERGFLSRLLRGR
ncbi:DivIVA domain-containing protein [Brachybacterium sp.]|uniref:DivIVA domain-containing protein n=1 Tax=Brachybacterium sp. TaxID=1891286 RepID=UPI002ED31068